MTTPTDSQTPLEQTQQQHSQFANIVTALYPNAKFTSAHRLIGGVSADVFRLHLTTVNNKPASVVLRAQGATHSGHPAELEHALLLWLHQAGVAVPTPLMVDSSRKLYPDPFLVMDFVEGSTAIAGSEVNHHVDTMADTLASIHSLPMDNLPKLPTRIDPLPEVFEFWPEGSQWLALRSHLERLTNTTYTGPNRLLHGDFWPEIFSGTMAASPPS